MSEKNYMNDSQAIEIMKFISDTMKIPVLGAGGGFAPIGTINSYMGTTAPIGWLVCDGTVYNIADYPDLAIHIASQFGSTNFFGGDGTTTFGVPDLRGEFLRGSGTNSHTNQGSGANVGVHQDATEHVHFYSFRDGSIGCFSNDANGNYTELKTDSYISGTSKNISVGANFNENDTIQRYTSRPTNTSVLFIIKATLSDAEINAFNVYTPREHQVAWWEEEIDGVWKRKPVYERTISGTSPRGTSATQFADVSSWNIEEVKSVSSIINYTKNGYNLILSNVAADGNTSNIVAWEVDLSSKKLNVQVGTYRTSIPLQFTIQYTKTTDDWQTS